MPLYVPPGTGPDWGWMVDSAQDARPGSPYGFNLTMGFNTKGAWLEVLTPAQVSRDVWFLQINFNSYSEFLSCIDLGVGPTGGPYQVLIPDMLVCAAQAYNALAGGFWYEFPVFVSAGSSIAVRGATAGGSSPWGFVRAFGAPRDPTSVKAGQRVVSYGVNATPNNWQGTIITPGQGSKGAWTALGTVAAGDYPWFWQLGTSCFDATMQDIIYHLDIGIGDASNKKIVLYDVLSLSTSLELRSVVPHRAYSLAKPGDIVYARAQCSGTPDSNYGMSAWGVI